MTRQSALRAALGVGLLSALIAFAGCGGTSTQQTGTTSTAAVATATATANPAAHPTATSSGSTSHPAPTATTAHPAPTATNTPSSGGGATYADGFTTVFVHVATSANIHFDYTLLDNGLTNNAPNLQILVTPNWTAGAHVYDTSPVGVFYTNGKWAIFNENKAAMQSGTAFNVLIYAPAAGSSSYTASTVTASAGNLVGDGMRIASATDASALVLVTQNWGVGGNTTYLNTPLGVYYYNGSWLVFREDSQPMPAGVSFNIFVTANAGDGFAHQASSGNSLSDFTEITEDSPHSASSGAIVFETPNYTYNNNHLYDTISTGVFLYKSSVGTPIHWSIFHQDGHTAITSGVAFNVLIIPL